MSTSWLCLLPVCHHCFILRYSYSSSFVSVMCWKRHQDIDFLAGYFTRGCWQEKFQKISGLPVSDICVLTYSPFRKMSRLECISERSLRFQHLSSLSFYDGMKTEFWNKFSPNKRRTEKSKPGIMQLSFFIWQFFFFPIFSDDPLEMADLWDLNLTS